MTPSIAAASRTVRVIGPTVASASQASSEGTRGTSPKVGLKPKTPQREAGILIEPRAVTALGKCAEAGGDRGGGASGGAARGAAEVPRVPGGRPDQIVGHVLVAEVRRVGFANEDRPCAAEAFSGDAVARGNVVAEED